MAAERESHVIISPHFDDGVFSCGGAANRLRDGGSHSNHRHDDGRRAGGSSAGHAHPARFAAALGSRRRSPASPPNRRRTRRRRTLGVDFSHIPLADCVYRVVDDVALYPTEESLFGEVHAADYAPRLLQGIGVLDISDSTTLYLPLAVGHHVDHQIVLDWGLRQIQAHPQRWSLRFYAEYPYSDADRSTEIALAQLGMSLRPADIMLSAADMQAKLAAIACYQSQISTFWRDLREMESEVRRAFSDRRTGAYVERLWQPAS